MGVNWILPIASKGKLLRDGRKLLDRSLRPGATALHRRLIEEKTREFLGQVLSTPKHFREHIDLLVSLLNSPTTTDPSLVFKENSSCTSLMGTN
jgi:hypothetical protein